MQQTIILIGLFICHFLADYTPLSTAWMLGAKRFGKPLYPIFCHAAVHYILMGLFLRICLGGWFKSWDIISQVLLLQLFSHFLIDVWKGRMNGWFPELQSPANKSHWIIFGFDQLLHAVVIILMAHYITNA
jgi:hypothetical protein